MARYTGPQYKKSRRLNFSTLENGRELARRPYSPGVHGSDRRKKLSEYCVKLKEKKSDYLFVSESEIESTYSLPTAYKKVFTKLLK